MDPKLAKAQTRIKQSLTKLLDVRNLAEIEAFFDEFLENLSKLQDISLLNDIGLYEWLSESVHSWRVKEITPPSKLACFSLNLSGILIRNKDCFKLLTGNKFFIDLLDVAKARQPTSPPIIHLAYLELLSSILEHKSGLELLLFHSLWDDALQLAVISKVSKVRDKSHQFIGRLLKKAVCNQVDFCCSVLQRFVHLVNKAIETSLVVSANLKELADPVAHSNEENWLRLIAGVLEYYFNEIANGSSDCKVLSIFFKIYKANKQPTDTDLIVRNNYHRFDICKIIFIMEFLELSCENIEAKEIQKTVKRIRNTFMCCFSNGLFKDVLRFCHFGHLYWKLLASKISCFDKEIKDSSFGDHILVVELIPHFSFMSKYGSKSNSGISTDDEFIEIYIDKLLKMSNPDTIRIIYASLYRLASYPNLLALCVDGLAGIKDSRVYFSREQGIVTFQTMVFAFKTAITALEENPDVFDVFEQKINYFSGILELILLLIKELEITWKDSFETIDIMALSFDFLNKKVWPTQLYVQALNLLNISISNYMTPNLALLVDRTTDSTMALLGPLLYDKLQEDNTDIRGAALECVCSMIKVSGKMFPSLQNVIIQSQLAGLVVQMSSSAELDKPEVIKCLQEMVQIDDLWKDTINVKDMTQSMKDVLLHNTLPEVRSEAAKFFYIAQKQQQVSKVLQDEVNMAMIHAALNDAYWKVRFNSLKFWGTLIHQHMQHEGMIDYDFPSITFSKDQRKIVVLTDLEIRKRIRRALDKLSIIGCLEVYVSISKNDNNREVVKSAVEVIEKISDFLKKYQFTEINDTPSIKQTVETIDYDEIIEQNVCWKSQVHENISTNDFLKFVQQENLNNLITKVQKSPGELEELELIIDNIPKIINRKSHLKHAS